MRRLRKAQNYKRKHSLEISVSSFSSFHSISMTREKRSLAHPP